MHLSKPQNLSNVAGAKRLVQLAAAFAAFRSVHGPGRRVPLGLRRQVLAALDAGVSASAIGKVCGVSCCGGRHMNAGALTLVDHVLPEIAKGRCFILRAPRAC